MGRKIRITVYWLISAFLMTVFAFCGEACSCDAKSFYGIELNATALDTVIGDTNLLYITEEIDESKITWTSEKQSVATVTDDGMVESVGIGETVIKAIYGDYVLKCSVKVSLGSELPQIVVTNEKSAYRIGVNENNFSFETYVSFNGKSFSDAEIIYKSSDDSVASFDEKGNLTIYKKGKIFATLIAVWRGMSNADMPSLQKVLEIEIVDEVFFYINGLQYDCLELCTVSEFNGQVYISETDFVPTAYLNGTEYKNVSYTVYGSGVSVENNVLKADSEGEGKILLSFVDNNGTEYDGFVNYSVLRPKAEYKKKLDYFSTYTGTFKDVENEYADTTVAKKLFGIDDPEGFKAFYENKELRTENGKIFGMPNDYKGSYVATLTVETNKVVYYVNVNVYAIVVQKAEDLRLFALKQLSADNDLTEGIDETRITCIDGYSVMLNDIDASGITIPHEIFDTEFSYVDQNGKKVVTGIDGVVDRYNACTIVNSTYDAGTEIFGFIGTFNGNGHTIFNLDVSAYNGKTGGGLFGYIMGNAKISDVALSGLKISNASGLAYGQSITGGRVMPQDKRGLRTDNTVISDVYIRLSEDTVNPKGAIFYKCKNSLGLIDLRNVIVNAESVRKGEETSGGSFIYEGISLCAENIENRFSASDVYLISDYPASFNKTVTVYGKNESEGKPLDGQTSGSEYWSVVYKDAVYSSKFSRYKTEEEMLTANLDYGSFTSSSWTIVNGYPVFTTAEGVYVEYGGERAIDCCIKVDSVKDGNVIKIVNINGEDVCVTGYNYNANELTVDNDGKITLAHTVTEETEYALTIDCLFNGKSKSVSVKVLAYPENYEITAFIETSADDVNWKMTDYVISPKKILSVTQTINGQNYDIPVTADGRFSGLKVVIKSDYSDVETSKLKITTSDMQYNFVNVKVYSRIIETAEDLNVFRHTKSTGRITGYYVLGNNIDATGYDIAHDTTLFDTQTLDSEHAFQGVLDGRGYAIKNFRPKIGGLLGSVYSDSEENGGRTIIRNVAFINMKSEQGKDFTVFGKFIQSERSGLTEVTNVHVQIDKVYLSDYNPTVNYKGLFHTNSSSYVNSFKFTNIYIKISEEDYDDSLYLAHGSVLSRDSIGVNSDEQSRSARFKNVITVTKINPCAYRQYVGSELTTEFDGIHMYVVYSETDEGAQGMRFTWLSNGEEYSHSPVSEDSAKGSYIYKGVYRYDGVESVDSAKIEELVDAGYWRINDGELCWASTIRYKGTGLEINFDTDWIGE